jgi:type IV pilus assembly protein PilW
MKNTARNRISSTGSTRVSGFTLLEAMVALTLGLLLSIGIISLFGSTSRTNKLQDGLARLQENGRYAVGRMQADLRMSAAQYCSNHSGNAQAGAVKPLWSGRAPMVFAPNLALRDAGTNNASVNQASGALTNATAANAYALSPRFFMQGYSCVSGSCTPAIPTGGASPIPTTGFANGSRVANSDVLTIRYQRGTGWPMTIDGNCVGGGTITVNPQPGDDPVQFATLPGLVMVSDCQNPSIIPVSGVAGNVLTVAPTMLAGSPTCSASAIRDMRVFNFSDNFVTVTYYLGYRTDSNPDAKVNSPAAQRLIPTLIRRENGVDSELVRGVDRLDFRYAVQDNLGNTRYLTAAQVNNNNGATITCPIKAEGVAPNPTTPTSPEPGCLWRAVSGIEAHLLVSTVDEVFDLDPSSRSYRYAFNLSGAAAGATVDQTALPSGLSLGSMLRREFIAQISNRNYNP